jgi:hypothetical protein
VIEGICGSLNINLLPTFIAVEVFQVCERIASAAFDNAIVIDAAGSATHLASDNDILLD